MDAEIAPRPFRQLLDDQAGNGADPGLERAAVMDEAAGVIGNGPIEIRRLGFRQGEERQIAFHEDVDVIEGQPMRMVRRNAPGARQIRMHLYDQQLVRVASGALDLLHGRSGMQRERDVSGRIRHGR